MKQVALVWIESQHELTQVSNIVQYIKSVIPSCEISAWIFGSEEIPGGQYYPFPKVNYIQGRPDNLYLPETVLTILTEVFACQDYDLIVFPSGTAGNELAVRLAFRLNVPCLTDVRSFSLVENGIVAERLVYNANLAGQFFAEPHVVISLEATQSDDESVQYRSEIELHVPADTHTWINYESFTPVQRENGLDEAKIVFVCGNGVGSEAKAEVIKKLGRQIGAEIAGTRPAIIHGWVPPERLVGISGKSISPQLCMVFGASGSGAFVAGIERSKIIIGVNSNPDALIFYNCDVGITDDCIDIAEALEAIVESETDGKL